MSDSLLDWVSFELGPFVFSLSFIEFGSLQYLFRIVENRDERGNYTWCDSYGEFLAIPAGIDLDLLKKVREYRSRMRFPIMCYFWELPKNQKNLGKNKFATLWRSAQVKAGVNWGLGQNRSYEDEYFIKLIGEPDYPYSFQDFVKRSQTRKKPLFLRPFSLTIKGEIYW